MTDPTTEAGRALLADLHPVHAMGYDTTLRYVLAIEADAYAAGAAAERERWGAAVEEGRHRRDDLRFCNKPDDCHVKAEGAALVIEDIEDVLGIRRCSVCGELEVNRVHHQENLSAYHVAILDAPQEADHD